MHDPTPISGASPLAATTPTRAPAASATGGASDTTAFQALLERLQRLAAAPANAPVVTSADDLGEAMRAADKTFTTAMDLRRQLEEAFRRHSP
jgi:hypothetical protein